MLRHISQYSLAILYLVGCYTDNMLYYLAFNWYFWFFIGLVLKSQLLADDGIKE